DQSLLPFRTCDSLLHSGEEERIRQRRNVSKYDMFLFIGKEVQPPDRVCLEMSHVMVPWDSHVADSEAERPRSRGFALEVWFGAHVRRRLTVRSIEHLDGRIIRDSSLAYRSP